MKIIGDLVSYASIVGLGSVTIVERIRDFVGRWSQDHLPRELVCRNMWALLLQCDTCM